MTFVAYDQLSPDAHRALGAYWRDVPRRMDVSRMTFEERAVPVAEAKRLVMRDPGIDPPEENGSFAAYHRWYMRFADIRQHTARWPVILNTDPSDPAWIDDGWHRFHWYVEAGDRTIPTLTIRSDGQTRLRDGRHRTKARGQ